MLVMAPDVECLSLCLEFLLGGGSLMDPGSLCRSPRPESYSYCDVL